MAIKEITIMEKRKDNDGEREKQEAKYIVVDAGVLFLTLVSFPLLYSLEAPLKFLCKLFGVNSIQVIMNRHHLIH